MKLPALLPVLLLPGFLSTGATGETLPEPSATVYNFAERASRWVSTQANDEGADLYFTSSNGVHGVFSG